MAAKRRSRAKPKATKRTRNPVALAVREPPVYVPVSDDVSACFVKLPIPPAVLIGLREHADNAARLLELVTGIEADAAGIFAAIAKTGAALARDVRKLRARQARRR